MHSDEYLDNVSGDCHHGAEAETRGGSAGNLHTTLPAPGIYYFSTQTNRYLPFCNKPQNSFSAFYANKHIKWHKGNY